MSLEPKFSQDAGLIMAGKISALLQTKPLVGQNCGMARGAAASIPS